MKYLCRYSWVVRKKLGEVHIFKCHGQLMRRNDFGDYLNKTVTKAINGNDRQIKINNNIFTQML